MLVNLIWSWACWAYFVQEFPWYKVRFIAYNAVGRLLYVYLFTIHLPLGGGGGSTSFCLWSSYLLLSTMYMRYLMLIWWIIFILFLLVMWVYVSFWGEYAFSCMYGTSYSYADNYSIPLEEIGWNSLDLLFQSQKLLNFSKVFSWDLSSSLLHWLMQGYFDPCTLRMTR